MKIKCAYTRMHTHKENPGQREREREGNRTTESTYNAHQHIVNLVMVFTRIFMALIETGPLPLGSVNCSVWQCLCRPVSVRVCACCSRFIKNAATTKLLRQLYRFHIMLVNTHSASGVYVAALFRNFICMRVSECQTHLTQLNFHLPNICWICLIAGLVVCLFAG